MLINIARRGNIATPTVYIFVFVNEVFIKINAKFPLQSMTKIYPTRYKSKHPPEIYLRLLPQNISSPRLGHMK